MKINPMKKTTFSVLFTIMLTIIPLSSAYNLNTYYEKQLWFIIHLLRLQVVLFYELTAWCCVRWFLTRSRWFGISSFCWKDKKWFVVWMSQILLRYWNVCGSVCSMFFRLYLGICASFAMQDILYFFWCYSFSSWDMVFPLAWRCIVHCVVMQVLYHHRHRRFLHQYLFE